VTAGTIIVVQTHLGCKKLATLWQSFAMDKPKLESILDHRGKPRHWFQYIKYISETEGLQSVKYVSNCEVVSRWIYDLQITHPSEMRQLFGKIQMC